MFPGSDVDEDDLSAVLRAAVTPSGGPDAAAPSDVHVEVHRVAQDDTHGYGGIVLARARRPVARDEERPAVPTSS